MGKLREAAHRAFEAVDQQTSHLPCVCAANNIVYEFLLEARKMRQESGSRDGGFDHLTTMMRKAADQVVLWPHRIYDAASAQKVSNVGPSIAKMIVSELFAVYPPEPPSTEELEGQREAEALIKQQQQKAEKKRKAGQPAAGGGASGGSQGVDAEQQAGLAADGGNGRKRSKKAAGEKQPNEYIPRIGTANFAFLLVLLEAQKGADRREFLTKQELMDRAEASGLADKPIHGDANPALGKQNPQHYYNGWSCCSKELINKHALVNAYSNPKKCALTAKGLDVAERLYRYAVESGKMEPIAGIPTSGPFLFEQAKAQGGSSAEGPPAAGRWEVPAAARPAAAAAPRAGPAQRPAVGVASAAAAVRPPAAAAAAAVARQNTAAGGNGAQPVGGGGYRAGGMLGVGPARTGAAAIAATFAAAAGSSGMLWQEELYVSAQAGGLGPQTYRSAAVAAGAVAFGGGAGEPPGRREQVSGQGQATKAAALRGAEAEVIDLLDDEDDPPPLAARLAGALAGTSLAGAGTAAAAAAAGRLRGDGAAEAGPGPGSAAADAAAPSDADVACMVEMGFTGKKARKALRRASNVAEAVELIDDLSSDSEAEAGSEDSPGACGVFHDALEELAEDEASGGLSPPPLGANPAIFGSKRPLAAVPAADQPSLPSRWELPPQRQQQPQQQQQQALWGSQQDTLGSQPFGSYPFGSQQQQPGAGPRALGHMRLGSQQASAQAGWGGSQSQHLDDLSAEDRAGSGSLAGAAAAARLAGGAAGPSGRAGGASMRPSGSIRQRREEIRLPPLPPGRCFRDEYEVVFVVDGREQYSRYNAVGRSTALEDHLNQMRRVEIAPGQHMAVVRRNLKIGDALWVARSRSDSSREYVLDFVVERKSVDDLVNSIKSGRYEKQKFWLRKCGLRHVYYLIEGDPDMLPSSVEQKSLRTSAANIEVVDKFRVLRTKGIHDTFRQYQALTKAIEAMYGPLRAPSGGVGPGGAAGGGGGGGGADMGAGAAAAGPTPSFQQWEEHMDRVSKDNTTLHDAWALMLGAVPGLGPEAVQAVIHHYPTPLSLCARYRQVIAEALAQKRDAVAAANGLLVGLKKEGGSRGMGAEKARSVYQLLFANSWNLAVA